MKKKAVGQALAFIGQHYGEFLWMLLYDVLFFVSGYYLFLGLGQVDRWLLSLKVGMHYYLWLPFFILCMFVALLFVVFIYAFFQWKVLGRLQQTFGKVRASPAKFKAFLIFHWKFMVPLLFLYLLAAANIFGWMRIKMNTVDDPIMLSLMFMGGFFVLFVLFVLGYCVTLLLQFGQFSRKEQDFWKVVKRTLGFSQWEFLWHEVKILFFVLVLLGGIHLFVQKFFFSNVLFYVTHYWIYKYFLWGYGLLLMYSLICFGRIHVHRRFFGE